MIQTISRLYLVACGLFFYIPLGALFLADPGGMFEEIGMVLGSELAVEEVRASHGGVWLLTGLLCVFSAWRLAMMPTVLAFLLIYNGGYALGRLWSFAFGGVPAMDLLPLFVFDLVLVLSSAVLLRGLVRQSE